MSPEHGRQLVPVTTCNLDSAHQTSLINDLTEPPPEQIAENCRYATGKWQIGAYIKQKRLFKAPLLPTGSGTIEVNAQSSNGLQVLGL